MAAQQLFGLRNKTEENKPPEKTTETFAGFKAKETAEMPKQEIAVEPEKPDKAEADDGSTRALFAEIRPHAFVVMPFGKKKGFDNQIIDFNVIYTQLIKPALETAGFEPFRADEEAISGDILTDMFQELLLADLAVVDMSIDNANVFYELGIRHAFRKRGVLHIQSGRTSMPFDVFNVRTLPYHTTSEGVPDPEFLEKDKLAISRMARATWTSRPETVHSPVYNLLTGLVEPDRKMLRTPLATGFWREYNEWKERVTVAQRQKRIGDILLLTEEIRNPLIKEEAFGEAGKALHNMGRHELALSQYRKGLEVNPRNPTFRREEAFHLNRVGRVEEAIVKLEGLLADLPNDTDAYSYLGRIYKEMWSNSWKSVKEKDARLRTAFDSYHWLLKSINAYRKGYQLDLDQFYPGVNALTLSTILVSLADQYDDPKSPDPEISMVRERHAELRGSLAFALETKAEDEKADYWTLVSLAELRVLISKSVQDVTRSYRKALTASRRNTFFLQSSLSQLEILRALAMRPEFVQAGINVLQEELRRMRKEDKTESGAKQGKTKQKPEGQVFLFTGYMVDNATDEERHFAADKEDEVREALQKVLDQYKAGSNDLAFTAGLSAGSEIIFAELCAERGIQVEAHLPVPEATYIRDFVKDGWAERFYKIRNHPLVEEMYQEDHIGKPREGDDLFERNNRWALYSSLVRGIDKVRLIAFWDGKSGHPKDLDARLVKHMVDMMRDTGGVIEHVNSAKFMHNYIASSFDGLPDLSQPAVNPGHQKAELRKVQKSAKSGATAKRK